MAEETWKAVVGFEGLYEVSDLGRVRSLDRLVHCLNRHGPIVRLHKGILLRNISASSTGYSTVSLSRDGKAAPRSVHSLVADAFLGPRAPGMLVLHKDGDRQNPKLSNLYHGTYADNAADAKRHGTFVVGERHRDAKLTAEAVREIRASTATQRALAQKFGVTEGAIAHVIHGRNWKSVTGGAAP